MVNIVDRKDKPTRNAFGEGFFWSEVADAAADIYNGVSQNYDSYLLVHLLIRISIFSGRSQHPFLYLFGVSGSIC